MERVTEAPSAMVNAPPILNVALVVVILLARFAAPVVEKPPAAVMAPVEFLVNKPELVMATAPVRFTAPLKLTATPVMVKVVSFVDEPVPTAPVNVTAPPAAFIISVEAVVPAPSVAPVMVTPPEPALRVMVAPLPIVNTPPILIRELVVEMLLARLAASCWLTQMRVQLPVGLSCAQVFVKLMSGWYVRHSVNSWP